MPLDIERFITFAYVTGGMLASNKTPLMNDNRRCSFFGFDHNAAIKMSDLGVMILLFSSSDSNFSSLLPSFFGWKLSLMW